MKKKPDKKLQKTRIMISGHETGKARSMPKHEAKRTAGSFAAELIFSVLLIASICSLRTVHVFANNVGLVQFSDLGISIWIYMGAGIVAFAILRIFLRKPYFAGIFVAFGIFLAVNFDWLVDFSRLFIKTYNPAAICSIALYLVIIVGLFTLLRLLYKKKFPAHIIVKILSITFAGLVLFNVVSAFIAMGNTADGDTQVVAVSDAAPVSTVMATPTPATSGDTTIESTPASSDESFGLPNVYFFILDEYGTFDIMSEYYGYDNDVFYQFLTMEGFNVSRESYATDNQTEHCFCDLLNLEYLSRYYSKQECKDAVPNAELFQAFSDLGYSQFQTSNSEYFKGIDNLNPDAGQGTYDDVNIFGDEAREM